MTTSDSASSSLAALEARHPDLEYLGWPGRNWMPARQVGGEPMLDVAVIGGGQAGLAASVALAQLGIRAVVFDRSPAGSEGPWATTARMETLRSPKGAHRPRAGPAVAHLPCVVRGPVRAGGLDGDGQDPAPAVDGLPGLVPPRDGRGRAQRHGRDRHSSADRCHRRAPRPRARRQGERSVLARRVVLATGRDGLGGPAIPAFVQRAAALEMGALLRRDGLRPAQGPARGRGRRGLLGHGRCRHRAGGRRARASTC